MPRAPTTLDPFNAIAEPKRRQVLEMLARGEMPVNDLVRFLGWPQPMVSKHLAVLKHVGLVSARHEGQKRLYSVNGDQLKPIHQWTQKFERFWDHHLSRVKERAERKAKNISSQIHPNSGERTDHANDRKPTGNDRNDDDRSRN